MIRRSATFVLATVLTAAPAWATDTLAHSGSLTAIDPVHHTVALSELGPWRGPSTRPITRAIALTPATKIELVQQATPAGGGPGGSVESPLTPARLHPGDFATVRLVGRGRHAAAESITVVRSPNG